MTTIYDNIAWQYKKSKELPIRQYAETYTYFHLIGEMAGKTILDLACGEGFYTRKFKQKGASTGWRKFPDHFKGGKEIRFFEKIGFLNGLKISALQHQTCGGGGYLRKNDRTGSTRRGKNPLGIEYIVGDVIELKKIGHFDLVVPPFY